MGYFNDKIDELMSSGVGTEAKTRQVIKMLDSMVFEPMRVENPDNYWDIMRNIHQIYKGDHYDEGFSIWEVEQMHHTESNGVKRKGEHWTMSEIKSVYDKYRAYLKPNDTVYDLYVALHSWWHDNIIQDEADFGDDAEAKNISRAIKFFFMDEDAPEGKVWHYHNAMRA